MSKRPDWLKSDFQHTFYDEQTLYCDDVKTLTGSYWLNDAVMTYYYLHLKNELFSDQQDQLLFISPTITFMMGMTDEDELISETMSAFEASTKDFIFIPITDNASDQVGGGSHWSVVMYDRHIDTFFYYDSIGTYNLSSARRMIQRMAPFIGSKRSKPTIEVRPCPAQVNDSDCGVYVLAVTENLARYKGDDSHLHEITPKSITQLRKKMLDHIGQSYNNK